MSNETQHAESVALPIHDKTMNVAGRTPGNRISILLVNEDSRCLARIRAILQKLGCQVRAISSFAVGVQCLGREPFDLILLDQGNGRFEGREVLAQAMEVGLELRVVILARAFDRKCYVEAMQSGALEYLVKPLSATEIVALVETFAPNRRVTCRTTLAESA
jgi:DNA-binding NtrC family response regulator